MLIRNCQHPAKAAQIATCTANSRFCADVALPSRGAEQQDLACKNSVARPEMSSANGNGVAAARYCARPSENAKPASTAAMTQRPAPLLSIAKRWCAAAGIT